MSTLAENNLERLKQGFLFWNKYRIAQGQPESRIDFTNLQIEGVHWKFNELKNANLSNCQFINTKFFNIDFLDIDFSDSDFTNASFENAHFANCEFKGTSFRDVIFKDTEWFHSNLSGIHFSDTTRFENIHFFKCSFRKDFLKELDLPNDIFEACTFDL